MDTFCLLPTIFLHFFDLHFLELKTPGVDPEVLKRECRLATRLSYLAGEEVLIPAASYFESPLCREVVYELHPLFDFGVLRLVVGGSNVAEFFDDKQQQYAKTSPSHQVYFGKVPAGHPPFRPRQRSATKDIVECWVDHLNRGKAGDLFLGTGIKVPKKLEVNWEKAPGRLGKLAFIVDNVQQLVIPKVGNRTVRSRLYAIVNEAYFGSFTREYNAGVVRDLVWLEAPHCIPSSGHDLPYKALMDEVRKRGLLRKIMEAGAEELALVRDDTLWMQALDASLARSPHRNGGGEGQIALASGWPPLPGPPEMVSPLLVSRRGRAFIAENGGEEAVPRASKEQSALVTIGIITALPHEFGAVKALLENTREHFVDGRGAGRRYWLGEVPAANGGSNTVALALLPDTGNTIASTRATLLLEHFQNAQAIIMTGIAGGVPFPEKAEHHVRLGDIIVSNRYGVVQYDYVKTERCREGEKEWVENTNRHPPRAPSALFLEAAVYLVAGEMEESKPWLGLIQQACERLGIRRPGEETDTLARSDNPEETVPHPRDDAREPGVPRVFRGPIASANVLLKDPIRRDALRDAFGVKAVEMEGSGISDATWTLEEGYFIVRGVCDYCDKNKGDAWQNYAAAAAAGYTITLLRSLPSQASPGTPAPEPAATKATPCVERLGQLPEPELRRLVTQRMSRKDLAAVWYDTLGGLMDDQMGDKGTGECAIELLTRAKQHGLLRSLFEHICSNRPDLAS